MTPELPTITTSSAPGDVIDVAFAEGITPLIVDKPVPVTIRMACPLAAGMTKQFAILKRTQGCNVRFELVDGQLIHFATYTGAKQTTSSFEPWLESGNLIEFISIPTMLNNIRTNGVFLTSPVVE